MKIEIELTQTEISHLEKHGIGDCQYIRDIFQKIKLAIDLKTTEQGMLCAPKCITLSS